MWCSDTLIHRCSVHGHVGIVSAHGSIALEHVGLALALIEGISEAALWPKRQNGSMQHVGQCGGLFDATDPYSLYLKCSLKTL